MAKRRQRLSMPSSKKKKRPRVPVAKRLAVFLQGEPLPVEPPPQRFPGMKRRGVFRAKNARKRADGYDDVNDYFSPVNNVSEPSDTENEYDTTVTPSIQPLPTRSTTTSAKKGSPVKPRSRQRVSSVKQVNPTELSHSDGDHSDGPSLPSPIKGRSIQSTGRPSGKRVSSAKHVSRKENFDSDSEQPVEPSLPSTKKRRSIKSTGRPSGQRVSSLKQVSRRELPISQTPNLEGTLIQSSGSNLKMPSFVGSRKKLSFTQPETPSQDDNSYVDVMNSTPIGHQKTPHERSSHRRFKSTQRRNHRATTPQEESDQSSESFGPADVGGVSSSNMSVRSRQNSTPNKHQKTPQERSSHRRFKTTQRRNHRATTPQEESDQSSESFGPTDVGGVPSSNVSVRSRQNSTPNEHQKTPREMSSHGRFKSTQRRNQKATTPQEESDQSSESFGPTDVGGVSSSNVSVRSRQSRRVSFAAPAYEYDDDDEDQAMAIDDDPPHMPVPEEQASMGRHSVNMDDMDSEDDTTPMKVNRPKQKAKVSVPKRSRGRPNPSGKTLPLPEADDNQPRRSKRNRIPRLLPHQQIEYELGDDACYHVKRVFDVYTPETPVMTAFERRMLGRDKGATKKGNKRQGRPARKPDPLEEAIAQMEQVPNPFVKCTDLNGVKRKVDCLRSSRMWNPVPADPEEDQANAPLLLDRLSFGNASLGIIILRPSREKGEQCSEEHSLVFTVYKGIVKVSIAEASVILAQGAMFLVPAMNPYNISNLSAEADAHLTFTRYLQTEEPMLEHKDNNNTDTDTSYDTSGNQ